MDPTASTSSWRPQQSALDDAAGEALRNQQEANMVFGAFAAASSGLVPEANTNWEYGAGGLPLSDLACDYCRVQAVQCARTSLAEACQFCRERNLECVGPGNNRRVRLFASVDQSLPGQPPSSGEYEIGQSVILRTGLETWDSTPRIVKRVIYKPVAVVLDDENSDPRPIDWIRPYPATWVNGPPRPLLNVQPVHHQQQPLHHQYAQHQQSFQQPAHQAIQQQQVPQPTPQPMQHAAPQQPAQYPLQPIQAMQATQQAPFIQHTQQGHQPQQQNVSRPTTPAVPHRPTPQPAQEVAQTPAPPAVATPAPGVPAAGSPAPNPPAQAGTLQESQSNQAPPAVDTRESSMDDVKPTMDST